MTRDMGDWKATNPGNELVHKLMEDSWGDIEVHVWPMDDGFYASISVWSEESSNSTAPLHTGEVHGLSLMDAMYCVAAKLREFARAELLPASPE